MENTSLDEKVKNLEVELSQARTQIERMSSAKLDKVLSAQKPSSDKPSLRYIDSSGPSSSMASRSKNVFVPQSEKGDKSMKSIIDLSLLDLILGSIVVLKLLCLSPLWYF